jgi:MYXO-CTERM domain-containing protein
MRAATLFAVIASALIAADDARACLYGTLVAEPEGQRPAPRNARLFVSNFYDAGTDRYLHREGTEEWIPLTTTKPGWAPWLGISVPPEPLVANETYWLYDDDLQLVMGFTTNDEIDHAPPPVPRVVHVETTSTVRILSDPFSSCPSRSEFKSVEFELEDLGDAVLTLVGREPTEPDQGDRVDGLYVAEVENAGKDPSVRGGAPAWPDADPGSSATFFIGTIDVAGNFSGWSDPIDVTLPAVSTVTCAHTSTTTPTPWSALALFSLLVVARRRRRTHPSVSRPLR